MKRTSRFCALAFAVVLLAACGSSTSKSLTAAAPTTTAVPAQADKNPDAPSVKAVQSDLRNAMTAEKTVYTDTQEYTSDIADLAFVEPSIDWGGNVKVSVSADKQNLCIHATSRDGVFAIGDVAFGDNAGTYYGASECVVPVAAARVAEMDAAWGVDPNKGPANSEREAQSDLRNALTTEKINYTDTQEYTDDVQALTDIESSLDWGGAMLVSVTADKQGVCLSTTVGTGVFSIGDVARGEFAGTYFGWSECTEPSTAENIAAMGASWDDDGNNTEETLTTYGDDESGGALGASDECETKILTVKTAVVAYRAMIEDGTAQPSVAELVDAGILEHDGDGMTISWAGGPRKPDISC